MTKLYMGIGALAVVGVAAVSYSMNSGAAGMATEPVELPEMDDSELVAMAQGIAKGDEDAPLTIVEFGDYQCPGCGSFFNTIKPRIEAAYVETGLARFVFYDFPLVAGHPNAFLAARASRCAADQDRAWDYHDELFIRQQEWSPAANPAGQFVDYAEALGLDGGAFEGCLESDRHADLVTANRQLAVRFGANSTPTVAVNDGSGSTRRINMQQGVDPWTAISTVADSMLAAAGAAPPTDSGEAADSGEAGDPGGGDDSGGEGTEGP